MNYFALLDRESSMYLYTGFNSRTLEELMDSYILYKSDEVDLSDLPLEKVLEYCIQECIIVESYKPIEK